MKEQRAAQAPTFYPLTGTEGRLETHNTAHTKRGRLRHTILKEADTATPAYGVGTALCCVDCLGLRATEVSLSSSRAPPLVSSGKGRRDRGANHRRLSLQNLLQNSPVTGAIWQNFPELSR